MMQQAWPWANPNVRNFFFSLWFVGVLVMFYQHWLPELWSNLGVIKRNQVLMAAPPFRAGTGNDDLAQAVRLFASSDKFDACNPLGFFAQSVIACAEVAQWTKEAITLADGTMPPAYFAPTSLGTLKYRQAFTLLLPAQEFSDLDSLTLLTYTGHSTRILQGDLVAYAVVITVEQEAYLLPLRAGIETAEGSYDFPDVPPQHIKPTIYYPHAGGGVAYPVQFHFDHPVSPAVITIVFTYAQRWHIEPVLKVWAILVERRDK